MDGKIAELNSVNYLDTYLPNRDDVVVSGSQIALLRSAKSFLQLVISPDVAEDDLVLVITKHSM